MAMAVKELIPQEKLAEILGVTRKTLIEWCKNGYHGETLERVKIGSRVFYEPEAVERLAKKTGKASS